MSLNIKKKNTFEWNKKNPCFKCDSLCCKDVAIHLSTPRTKKDWDEIKWLVIHKKVQVYKDLENDWMVEFFTDCEMLDKEGKCKIHDNRPQTCYEHSHKTCVFNSDEKYYKVIFKKLEDVENYLKTKNYKWFNK